MLLFSELRQQAPAELSVWGARAKRIRSGAFVILSRVHG
jgi:hypothetical protein